MAALEIVVTAGGRVQAVYADDLLPVLETLGRPTVRRASHVEPGPDGGWLADLTPVAGPVLGPFRLREDALAAELKWLRPRLGRLNPKGD